MLYVFLFKFSLVISGTASMFFGYRLFHSGVWGQAGDLEARYKDNKLLVKSAAPGTFFALFGSVVVIAAAISGFQVSTDDYNAIGNRFDDDLAPWDSYRLQPIPQEPDEM